MSASVAFLGPARLSGELRAGLGGRAYLSSFAWGRSGEGVAGLTRRPDVTAFLYDNGFTLFRRPYL